jgi:hypothetical protein
LIEEARDGFALGGIVRCDGWAPDADEGILERLPRIAHLGLPRCLEPAIHRRGRRPVAFRNVRMWRTASGIFSGVSFQGYMLTCELGASIATSIATA